MQQGAQPLTCFLSRLQHKVDSPLEYISGMDSYAVSREPCRLCQGKGDWKVANIESVIASRNRAAPEIAYRSWHSSYKIQPKDHRSQP